MNALKVKMEHHYQVRRIVLDKVLLGLLIGAFAFVGKLYMEDYRSELDENRFLMENRLTGLTEIRQCYTKLSNSFVELKNAESQKHRRRIRSAYEESLERFSESTNKWSVLFPPEFDRQMSFHYWFHQSVVEGHAILNDETLQFAIAVFKDFDRATRENLAIEREELTIEDDVRIRFVNTEGIGEYFQANYNAWVSK